jgi:hypothetical protein
MQLVETESPCVVMVQVFDRVGCPVLSMPAFTIFLDQWPWIAAYALIGLGAYMLIFGRLHFSKILKFFITLVSGSVMMILLSINGYFESKIEEGPTSLTNFLIVLVLIVGTGAGVVIGHYIPQKAGLVFMCVINANVISMLIYSFLMSFTGTWIVLITCSVMFSGICFYLPLKFET